MAPAREIICEVRLVNLPSGNRRLVRGSIADISERKRAERVSAVERQVFEQLTRNAPLPEVLASITALIESAIAGTAGSVSLLARTSPELCLRAGPAAAGRAVQRPRAHHDRHPQRLVRRSVYLGRQVLVADLAKDPFWQEQREPALAAGKRAAWSTPIKSANGSMLGSLGVYRAEVGLPAAADTNLMARAAQLAGIAIERSRGEEALRSSEAKFRGLFESIAEGVYQSGRDGRLLSVNPAFVAMLGYDSAEELYALPSASQLYWNPADRARFANRVDTAGRDPRCGVPDARPRRPAAVVPGERAAMRDAGGKCIGYEGTIVNITERKRAEQAMFAEKERAQVTLQSIGDAVISTDADGRIEYINPVAESLTAWSLDEARGQPIGDRAEPRERAHARADREAHSTARTGAPPAPRPADHAVLVTRAGQEVAIQESAAPICDRQGQRHRRGDGVPRRHQGAAPEARAVLAGQPRCAHRPHQPPRVRQPPARWRC